jgi:hypothetical protein
MSDILNIKEDELMNKVKDKEENFIFEAEVFYGGGIDLEKDIEELLINFEEEYLKEKLNRKMRELQDDKSNEVLREINEINKKIQDIKNGRLKK